MQKSSFQELFDRIYQGFVQSVRDVREKLVEEPWFGRVVSDEHSQSSLSAASVDVPEKGQSFTEYCAERQGKSLQEYEQEQEFEQPREIDQEMER